MNENINMVKISARDLYKAIKNYLHNELGLLQKIDQAYLDKMIEKAIQAHVDRLFADKAIIEQIIERKIAEAIKHGELTMYYGHKNKSFGTMVIEEIKRAVRDHIVSKLAVQVSLNGVELKESPDE